MKRLRPSWKYSGMAALLALGAALWLVHSPSSEKPAHRSPEAATPPTAEVAVEAVAAPAAQEVAAAPAAASAAVEVTETPAERFEKKKALNAGAVAARIAEREARLSKLDWDAPRPGAPNMEGRHPIGKSEAAMEPAEKLDETQIMISRLRERRGEIEARMKDRAAKGEPPGSDAFMIDRLSQRMARLEGTARSLQDSAKQDSAK